MFDCNNLSHPFQNDAGVSQHQRILDDLLSDSPKIDGRKMADLLDYFVQLSRHINYYDTDLSISDWHPFFQKSLPFTLASIIKYDRDLVSDKIDEYAALFNNHPSGPGLQLLIHYTYYQIIDRINAWHIQLEGSGLPSELVLLKLIKDKLHEPLRQFICYHNIAVTLYCIKPLNFLPFLQNEVWDIDSVNLHHNDCKPGGNSRRKRLMALHGKVRLLLPAFLDATRILASTSELCLEQSLFPLKEELQEKHTPHLALLFAFLKLFQHLQGDLNSFTKKHLDFFYKDVLKLKAKEASPDKAHLVFEIQKQLNTYLLRKGLQVKDGKDINKAEIRFTLDDEIVVNKTQVADKRTLFLNNKSFFEKTYLEGVYMAIDAGKTDGVSKEFKDNAPKSFPTLGAKLSKYTGPGKSFPQPYPNARLGFILASPVLLLNEGERTIDITLACELKNNFCSELPDAETPDTNNCCEERDPNSPEIISNKKNKYEDFIKSEKFNEEIKTALQETYYYVSEDLLIEASKKGTSKDLEKKLRQLLIETKTKDNSSICYCPVEIEKYDIVLKENEWNTFYYTASADEKKILDELFKPFKALNILFSGEKEWITPAAPYTIDLSPSPIPGDNKFLLKIHTLMETDQPAVTFYDKDKLKEDFNSTLPMVKIELDDKIKMMFTQQELEEKIDGQDADPCCLLKDPSGDDHAISLYHFFRNVVVVDKVNGENTRIDVKVCGVKNFIVQNDESVQDVNSPVFPFGTRPDVPDFSVINPYVGTDPNLVGPNFYVGSNEVLRKKWNDITVNINWKDLPSDFNDYYKAYYVNPSDKTKYGLEKENFQINISVLEDGKWQKELLHPPPSPNAVSTVDNNTFKNRPLFRDDSSEAICDETDPAVQKIYLKNKFFSINQVFRVQNKKLQPIDVNTFDGFLRINLQNQDFLHKDYSFVLARQMVAFGKLPNEHVEGAVYYDSTIPGGGPIVISTTAILLALTSSGPIADRVNLDVQDINTIAGTNTHNITSAESDTVRSILRDADTPNSGDLSLNEGASTLDDTINDDVLPILNNLKKFAAIIPNEPWTPIIKNMSLDYTATAANTDIDLIHLYPYHNTHKHEEITLQPSLLPTFCDEGYIFIGLQDLVPGNNLNILFQLAEATADSESEQEEVNWYYLDNNQWKSLRSGFEILDDATNGLTASGVIKFALPENMTSENTILPKGLHWIGASIPQNSRSVCETIDIHTQAILSTFTNEENNDKSRLAYPLPAGAISRLNEADTHIKKLAQPYDSFGGRLPEADGHFYVRVSELLRHKGRGIQKFDYERLALEAFPQLFRAKCINHSFALNGHQYKNDFTFSPGYVILAVIPDLNKLNAARSFEPRVPVSILENIAEYIRERTSPFVRFRAMNPRYERVDFCLKVRLMPGKDENFYKEKLKQDIRELLAPWAVGKYDKLSFGQCVNRSDIIRLLETSDYIDFILELCMVHEEDNEKCEDHLKDNKTILYVCPKTPRSILIAGDIDVCIPGDDCDGWDKRRRYKNQPTPIADYCQEIVIE